jgi:hypothetical protein
VLFDHNIDFNLLDADAINRAQVQNGALLIGGYTYRAMIMPEMDIIPLAVLRKLKQFASQGGTLIWAGKLPTLGDTESETAQVQKLLTGAKSILDPQKVVEKIRVIGDGGLRVTATRPDN